MIMTGTWASSLRKIREKLEKQPDKESTVYTHVDVNGRKSTSDVDMNSTKREKGKERSNP